MGKEHVVSRARDFALRVHGTQHHAGRPYAEHLDEVAVLVRKYGDDHQAVAYLQHVLEHDPAPLPQIRDEFGPLVASCVELFAGEPGTDPKERERLVYARLARIPVDDERAIALLVRVADRLADAQYAYLNNERGQLRKLRRDHRDFHAAVFRPSFGEELWRELTDLVVV